MRRLILISALTTGLIAGCAQEAETVDPNGGSAAAGKADCPNCDPHGANAFEQAGLDVRWYRPGDQWHVAFQFRNHGGMAREDFLLPTQKDEWVNSGVFLFQYEVLRDVEPSPMTGDRAAVEIEVSQADPQGTVYDSLGYFESERLDRHQKKVRFVMNDLTDAVNVTYFNRRYPHGKTVRAPSKAALALNNTIFPVNVPRLLVGGKTVTAPELPADLAKVADRAMAGWDQLTYKRYVFANGDEVYWAKGHLWPFYVINGQGRGLLLASQVN